MLKKIRFLISSFSDTNDKKKSRASSFFFLVLFTLHFSLISPTRLFQRRDKREERKENVSFHYGEKQF